MIKSLFTLSLIPFLAFSQGLSDPGFVAGLRIAAAGGGGAAFSDDFNRGNEELSAGNWTEAGGDQDVLSNQMSVTQADFVANWAIYNTSCNTANQYVKFTLVAGAAQFMQLVFRYTDSSSTFYTLELNSSGGVDWYSYPNTAGSGTLIASSAVGVADGDIFGITITGTGTSTVVRVWRNPTGLPIAADNWDGDTSPDQAFTTDPASPVDTGSKVGLGGFHNATLTFDNFFGGDIP